MPSRNRLPNAAELASRSLKWTRAPSSCERSDMLNASYATIYAFRLWTPAYDEQIIAQVGAKIQRQGWLWFPRRVVASMLQADAVRIWHNFAAEPCRAKKSRRDRRLCEVDNREASNRVDRSHSVSKRGHASHKRESLTDRKRSDFFKDH